MPFQDQLTSTDVDKRDSDLVKFYSLFISKFPKQNGTIFTLAIKEKYLRLGTLMPTGVPKP